MSCMSWYNVFSYDSTYFLKCCVVTEITKFVNCTVINSLTMLI